jgi:hypothetical protein
MRSDLTQNASAVAANDLRRGRSSTLAHHRQHQAIEQVTAGYESRRDATRPVKQFAGIFRRMSWKDIGVRDEVKWHWGEGAKYAVEAIKTLFIINGVAAVFILTFIGNVKSHDNCGVAAAGYKRVVVSMLCFGVGALTAVCTQASAYMTQFKYGNASQFSQEPMAHRALWDKAATWHHGAGVFLFLAGVSFAAMGLS